MNAGYPEPGKQRVKFRRYVTQGCLKEAIAADDYVYFIQAQDAEPGWKNHTAVAAALDQGAQGFDLGDPRRQELFNKLKIELVQEKVAWKINNVRAETN